MKTKYPARVRLAHLPTPIHNLPRLSAEVGREIHVWRDDLTGFIESGNKIRKLEFLLADALAHGAATLPREWSASVRSRRSPARA